VENKKFQRFLERPSKGSIHSSPGKSAREDLTSLVPLFSPRKNTKVEEGDRITTLFAIEEGVPFLPLKKCLI